MTKFYSDMKLDTIVSILEKDICPRRYWLHSAVGSDEWRIDTVKYSLYRITIASPKKATFVMMKIPSVP